QQLVLKYRQEIGALKNTFISGRLGDYKYYDMHDTINHALDMYDKLVLEPVNGQAIIRAKSTSVNT
ncbi:MAG TPA: hypothetical protein VI413_09110, partial [Paludibacter sp.]